MRRRATPQHLQPPADLVSAEADVECGDAPPTQLPSPPTQRAGGVASGLRRAKRVARHGNGQQDDEKTEFKGGKVTIELINFLRYTHFNNSTGYWGPREEYKGKPVPPNGRASLWVEEAQMPENALKAFQTAEGDKPEK